MTEHCDRDLGLWARAYLMGLDMCLQDKPDAKLIFQKARENWEALDEVRRCKRKKPESNPTLAGLLRETLYDRLDP